MGRDLRTPGQRRADALGELCRRVLDAAALPDAAGEKPHITVTVALPWLERRAGHHLFAPPTRPGHGPPHLRDPASPTGPASPTPRGDPSSSGPLPGLDGPTGATAAALRRLLCDAQISRIVLAADSQPLDVGRATRTVTPAQRRALRIRDNGCRFPGCDRPHPWTDAHHIHYWRHGGATDLANLISLCQRHHHTVHDGGWTITTSDLTDMAASTSVALMTHPPGTPAAGSAGRAKAAAFWFVDRDGIAHPARDPQEAPRLTARLTQALLSARARTPSAA
jgi:hypothetical protein